MLKVLDGTFCTSSLYSDVNHQPPPPIPPPPPPPKLTLAGEKSADCNYYWLHVTLFQRSMSDKGVKRKRTFEGEGRQTETTPKKTRKSLQKNAKENGKQADIPGKYFQHIIPP